MIYDFFKDHLSKDIAWCNKVAINVPFKKIFSAEAKWLEEQFLVEKVKTAI